MSVDGWNTALVLGGIRSGKSAFAAALLADEANVRCVVAAADGPSTGGPVATELRRPGWMVEQSGEPTRLIHLIADAAPGETLLIDDLAGWVRRLIEVHSPTEVTAAIDRLASAVHACRARLVLVSAEAGLTAPAALAAADRVFVDTLATLNLAVARACDTVTLVVAGQPIRLRPSAQVPQPVAGDRSAAPTQPVPSIAADSATGRQLDVPAPAAAADAWTAPTAVLPVMSGAEPVFEPGMDLPLPDEGSAAQALDRLATLDFPGGGLG
ncbi:MAG TPA: bifunctional adenosylcobinamide kinase/adenosylcobinamide-phosphate guanylyltransferase, partial [Micromonosporaceae bacterium]